MRVSPPPPIPCGEVGGYAAQDVPLSIQRAESGVSQQSANLPYA